jgi:RNA polymerase sigma factor (TIGR02999 family)
MSDSQTDPVVPGGLDTELYGQLRKIAQHYLRSERANHTLQPTELVSEMYLKLDRRQGPAFTDRRHFLAVACIAMRAILVDHARARLADKRGGGVTHVTVSEANAIIDDKTHHNVLDIDAALTRLNAFDPELERIVVMRFFGGMTEAEVAETVGKSDRWVRSQWAFARAWLRRALEEPKG